MKDSVIKPVSDPLTRALEAMSLEDLTLLMLALERKRKEVCDDTTSLGTGIAAIVRKRDSSV